MDDGFITRYSVYLQWYARFWTRSGEHEYKKAAQIYHQTNTYLVSCASKNKKASHLNVLPNSI